jgi:hypothetical protein
MKIWNGYGSEHSMNLVMIGHFQKAADAVKAKQIIDQLTAQVNIDVEDGRLKVGDPTNRFTEGMLQLLTKINFHQVSPDEVEQMAYDVNVELDADKVVITTNESDVSVFLKLLVDEGARVEVYSAHFHKGTGYGR